MEHPELTQDQLKRFRQFLVDCRYAKSFTVARKMTPDKRSCHETFLKAFPQASESIMSSIEDILDLYAVEDDWFPIPESVVPSVNPVVDSKEVGKRVRGEGKKPKKSTFLVAFEPIQLERLKQLGGNVSNHIRAAVDSYLDSKRIDEKPEGVDDG